MNNDIEKITYLLDIDTKDLDATLAKLNKLNKTDLSKLYKQLQAVNQKSVISSREQRTVDQHNIAQAKIAEIAGKASDSKKKTRAYAENLIDNINYKYAKLQSDRELAEKKLDTSRITSRDKLEEIKLTTALREKESVEKLARANEKTAQLKIENVMQERNLKYREKASIRREDNSMYRFKETLRYKEATDPIRNKLTAKKLDNAEKKLALETERLALRRKQQQRLEHLQQRAGRGSRRPFESMMMAIGSFMLLQYAVQMPFMWAKSLGDAMANVETDSRKGNAYRQDLINKNISTKNFDTAVEKYSELSGTQGYLARARLASIYGQLGQKNINAAQLNPEAIANVLQGLTVGMGMSDEQADKKLAELLANKITKEDKKLFGIRSRTPMQILEEINNTFQKNPVIASTLRTDSTVSNMKYIAGAKNELLSRVDNMWGDLFASITRPIKEFTKTFFGLDNKRVYAEWVTTLSTFRDNIEQVFTKENAERLAIFTNRFASSISIILSEISSFVIEHPKISGALATIALLNKSKTGSVFDPSWIWNKNQDSKGDGARVFVTNMPKNLGNKSGGIKSVIGSIIATKIAPIFAKYLAPGALGVAIGVGLAYANKEKIDKLAEEARNKREGRVRQKQRIIASDLSQADKNMALEQMFETDEQFKQYYISKKGRTSYDKFEEWEKTLGKEVNQFLYDLDKPMLGYKESLKYLDNWTRKPSVLNQPEKTNGTYITATNIYMNGKSFETDTLLNGLVIGGY